MPRSVDGESHAQKINPEKHLMDSLKMQAVMIEEFAFEQVNPPREFHLYKLKVDPNLIIKKALPNPENEISGNNYDISSKVSTYISSLEQLGRTIKYADKLFTKIAEVFRENDDFDKCLEEIGKIENTFGPKLAFTSENLKKFTESMYKQFKETFLEDLSKLEEGKSIKEGLEWLEKMKPQINWFIESLKTLEQSKKEERKSGYER